MGAIRYLLAGLTVSLVFAMIVVGVHASGAPETLPLGAPAESFSAERALVALRVLTTAPRPMGAAAPRAARRSIVASLCGIGLVPRVQTAGVVSARDSSIAGTVRNVVARLPGRGSSRALVLVAHYDSVATAAGAADDASGVAALLETARALSVGPRLRNDVVFLFTDGEERGMLGAQALLRDDPWSSNAGLVLNLDSPGSSTAVVMYETSPGNGALVRELARGLPRAHTSSLLYAASYFPQLGMRQTTVGAAPRIGLETARVQVLQDTVSGDRRKVRLRLTSPRAAPVLSLLLHTVVGKLTAEVDGRPLSGKDTAVLDNTSVRWRFDYYAPPQEGIVVTLRFAAGPSVLLRAVDCSYGIPAELAGRYAARPLGVLPGGIGDTTLTEAVLRLPPTGERGAGQQASDSL